MSNVLTKLQMVCLLLGVMMVNVEASTLPDPTRPPQYHSAVRRVSFNLESILFGDSRRVAVINGKVLAEGETIGGAKVLSISKDIVRLTQSGKVIRLTLRQPSIRQEK